MKVRKPKGIAVLLIVAIISQLLVGCTGKSNSPPILLNIVSENVFQEDYVDETFVSEEKLRESYIIENLIYEDEIYEYKISEYIISEAYTIEVIVGEETQEDILAQLPEEIEDYDINWPKIIGKFAVGTSIIIAVGIVNHVSIGSTYFVFATPVSVAAEALVGGAIRVTLTEVMQCLKNGKMPKKGVAKYAIEGFADGFMWGAINAVRKIALENFKRLKHFKLATGGKASIKPDGRVFDESGQLIGQAYYDRDGIWYLLGENTLQVFNKSGKAITDKVLLSKLKSLPHNTSLRLGTAQDALICHTDDKGIIFRIGDELIPNHRYTIKGYNYSTDNLGRISKVAFDELRLKPEGRKRLSILDNIRLIGKGFEKISDNRGHLIADSFDGDNTMANIVLMDSKVNLGTVKKIEDTWRMCLENEGHVQGSIELSYIGESFRPNGFVYMYDMGNGSPVIVTISNLS